MVWKYWSQNTFWLYRTGSHSLNASCYYSTNKNSLQTSKMPQIGQCNHLGKHWFLVLSKKLGEPKKEASIRPHPDRASEVSTGLTIRQNESWHLSVQDFLMLRPRSTDPEDGHCRKRLRQTAPTPNLTDQNQNRMQDSMLLSDLWGKCSCWFE